MVRVSPGHDGAHDNEAGIAPPGYFESAEYASRDWRSYTAILGDAITNSRPGPMLDLGAGAGFLVEAAQRWGLDCEGVEGSAAAIDGARERFPEIRLRQGLLGEPLPWPDATFETAFLNQVIEHLTREAGDRLLREARRVLRDGALLYITSPSRFDRGAMSSDPTHVHLYTPSELESSLRQAGFSTVVHRNIPLPIFGRGRVGMLLATGVFRLAPVERLSATADCLAYA